MTAQTKRWTQVKKKLQQMNKRFGSSFMRCIESLKLPDRETVLAAFATHNKCHQL